MAALSKWVPIGEALDPLDTQLISTPKLTTIDKVGGIYCHICQITFGNKKDYDSHYMKHGVGSADIVYTCVVCRREIVGYPSFRGHCYLKHVMKDKFKCEYCQKVFSKLCVLKTHIKALHHFKCATCNQEFKNQKELTVHQIIHKNDQGPPYDCGVCGKQIDSTDDCEQHIEDHCNMTYSCPICDEAIADIGDAAGHMTKHFGNVLSNDPVDEEEEPEPAEVKNDSSIDLLGGIFCCHCDEIFKARPEFDNHFVVEHPDKLIIYSCNICAKEYESYVLFANHCYDHYARGRYQCEVCFKCFPRLSLLVGHVSVMHAAGAATLPCVRCGRAFRTQRRLRDHQRALHQDSRLQCPDPACSMIFTTSRELTEHIKEHKTGNWCRTCGLYFRSHAACARHVHVHRKATYRCPVCARAYHEKYLVVKHVNQHFSSVLHICKICGKVYNARSRLNNHMKVHNEVKDHTCTYCGKGFTKAYLLEQHVNIHTGLRPFNCTACSKTFASKPNLQKHMKCMHNITKIDMKLCHTPNRITKIPNPRPNTKIEKLTIVETPIEHEIPNVSVNNNTEIDIEVTKNPNESNASVNNNTEINVEVTKNLPVLENLDVDAGFDESDDNGWQMVEEIDPGVLEMLEKNLGNMDEIEAGTEDITELENALWVQSPAIPTAMPTSPTASPCPEPLQAPREYGPDFGAALALLPHLPLDDAPLPHVDPRLAAPPRLPGAPLLPPGPPLQAWEPPVYTKLPDLACYDQDVRYAVLSTDIY